MSITFAGTDSLRKSSCREVEQHNSPLICGEHLSKIRIFICSFVF